MKPRNGFMYKLFEFKWFYSFDWLVFKSTISHLCNELFHSKIHSKTVIIATSPEQEQPFQAVHERKIKKGKNSMKKRNKKLIACRSN